MLPRTMLTNLLLFVCSLCWVSCNEILINRILDSSEELEEESVMNRMPNVTTYRDFLSLLVDANGRPVTEDDIISNFTDSSGAIYINSGGRMATPDECSPRDTTVRLNFDNSNPNVVYFPKCTKIERCGGCCATAHLECVPSYTERVTYKVIKAEVPYPGSTHLEWKGEFSSVILERHVNCRVQCTLTADKCGPKKEFMERQCECKCKVYERCQPPRVWDPEECECKCAEVHTCCKNGEPCGMTFVKETCDCGVDTNVDSNVELIRNSNHSQVEIDAYFSRLNNSSNHTVFLAPHTLPTTQTLPTSTSTEQSSTDTTTAETTTHIPLSRIAGSESDPCPTVVCPTGFFKQVVPPDGECTCSRRGPRIRNRNSYTP